MDRAVLINAAIPGLKNIATRTLSRTRHRMPTHPYLSIEGLTSADLGNVAWPALRYLKCNHSGQLRPNRPSPRRELPASAVAFARLQRNVATESLRSRRRTSAVPATCRQAGAHHREYRAQLRASESPIMDSRANTPRCPGVSQLNTPACESCEVSNHSARFHVEVTRRCRMPATEGCRTHKRHNRRCRRESLPHRERARCR